MLIKNRYFNVNNRDTKSVWEYNVATGRREIVLAVKSGRGCTRSFCTRRKKQMAPSWLNLSAHLNKSNVGRVPARRFFLFSLVSFFVASRLSHIRHLHHSRFSCSSPCYARVVLRFPMMMMVAPTSLHLNRPLEIAIMLLILPLPASQFFRKAWL